LFCVIYICQPLWYVAVAAFDMVLLTGTHPPWLAAQLQASLPRVQPTAEELLEMNRRAAEVVRLLEEYRRLTQPEFERRPTEANDASRSVEGNRPPKRPWEDIAKDDPADEGPHGEVRNIKALPFIVC
jgi:hypothetical protein